MMMAATAILPDAAGDAAQARARRSFDPKSKASRRLGRRKLRGGADGHSGFAETRDPDQREFDEEIDRDVDR